MPIQLYDSLERKLKPLAASHKDGVFRFYNCGPTVYAPAHIGNFRTFVINDVLRRLLELEFGADKVRHVRNLTDIDDKTIKRAQDEGRLLAEVTKQWTDKFHADCAALNCLRPHVEPAATGHIREQVDMIDVLMKKGNAYRAADGSVYFRVSSFKAYGELSRLKERELKTGAALDSDEKEDGSDFALWKAHKPDDGTNAWDSPWGRGRPGWHIECSAMSKKHLGETIDLHSGGVDLLFPHHENEIAQSQCCNGTTFAHHWYHSEHLLVDGKKMSKSLGNLYTLDDLRLIQRDDYEYNPVAVRYALLLMGHPSHQLNFTLQSLGTALHELRMLKGAREWWIKLAKLRNENLTTAQPAACFTKVIEDLQDNLNTTAARSHLRATIGSQEVVSSKVAGLDHVLSVLGLDLSLVQDPVDELRFVKDEIRRLREKHHLGEIGTIEEVNAKLRKLGWKVEVSGDTWHPKSLSSASNKADVPAAITALAEKRWAAKQAKDFAGADALRKELAAAGWSMLDGKDGYKLEPVKKGIV